MAEFMFVNLNDPSQNKRNGVRKLVRSHVSHMQHSQKRIELGQIQKQTKYKHTNRSVNGWMVLDDSRSSHLSQRNAKAASCVDSTLPIQCQSTSPGIDPVRRPRQLYKGELAAPGGIRRRSGRDQCQPKASPTPPTPIFDDDASANEDSVEGVSTLPAAKSELAVTRPEGIIVNQAAENQTDHKWDIVSQHSSQLGCLSSSSTPGWSWELDESSSASIPHPYSSLGDPTDELRNWIELLRICLPSVMVLSLQVHVLEMQR